MGKGCETGAPADAEDFPEQPLHVPSIASQDFLFTLWIVNGKSIFPFVHGHLIHKVETLGKGFSQNLIAAVDLLPEDLQAAYGSRHTLVGDKRG